MFRARSIGCLRDSVGSRVRILFGVIAWGLDIYVWGLGGSLFGASVGFVGLSHAVKDGYDSVRFGS